MKSPMEFGVFFVHRLWLNTSKSMQILNMFLLVFFE